jgi:hypothetical protein
MLVLVPIFDLQTVCWTEFLEAPQDRVNFSCPRAYWIVESLASFHRRIDPPKRDGRRRRAVGECGVITRQHHF